MKKYKTVNGFIKHLKEISNHGVVDLKGSENYTREQMESLTAIKATIDNEIGENFSEFKDLNY